MPCCTSEQLLLVCEHVGFFLASEHTTIQMSNCVSCVLPCAGLWALQLIVKASHTDDAASSSWRCGFAVRGQGLREQSCGCMQGASALKLYTQVGALGFAVVLGARRAAELRPYAGRRALFVTDTMLQLVAGAMVLRYAVDQNERAGLGDGIALLICAGIGSREPLHPPPLS